MQRKSVLQLREMVGVQEDAGDEGRSAKRMQRQQ
jgi:hypothetical protein